MNARVDHLVVIAHSLSQGEDWVRQTFGAAASAGGEHHSMGTHNSLLRVGPDVYLEVIAIDPKQRAPARARWFDMDRPDVQSAAKRTPYLAHFVARTSNLATAIKGALHAPGEIVALARGTFRWNITVAQDGSLSEHGLVPTLIQWQDAKPIDTLTESGVSLERLLALHPDPARLRELHSAIGLEGVAIERGAQPELIAVFDSPRGKVRLSSRG